ncbi:hypothetical protein OOK41_17145 [Micromonospora sp. NBC_01655]|uniref:hypothetical protein n=1 Tax=Micromonospora sp. NBC_01655 TaxID=2975983 RepID=UPI00224CEDB0|nr:hypothetical protein [Micromonospora sp. NBC_01655]MCX4472013.1 hypothetical protein [Micromonospora sp. NBC_01655]
MPADFLSSAEMVHCLAAIRDKFLHDCMTGTRRRVLPDDVCASGQYFDLPQRTQRGLHGTAAALRVVGAQTASSDLVRSVTRGIVNYVRDREGIEVTLAEHDDRIRTIVLDKLRHDSASTIKQAEFLYALTFVPNGLAECDDLKTAFSNRLLTGGTDDGQGWGFILGPDQVPHPLATAHALRALARNGHPVDRWITATKQGLLGRAAQPRRNVPEAGVDCFLLQVLVETDALTGREGRLVFDGLWRLLRRDMDRPREINVDFFDGDRQNFVRVPWQLHLATTAAMLRPYRRYLSGDVQRPLQQIAADVLEERGFRYPESGEHLSTRTYGILYDTFSQLSGRTGARGHPDNIVLRVISSVDTPLRMGRRLLRLTAALLAAIVLAAGLWSWAEEATRSWSDLAPNFISSAVLAVLSYAVGRGGNR